MLHVSYILHPLAYTTLCLSHSLLRQFVRKYARNQCALRSRQTAVRQRLNASRKTEGDKNKNKKGEEKSWIESEKCFESKSEGKKVPNY